MNCIPNFAHHWMIDNPEGHRWVWAQCKNCKNFRLFGTVMPNKMDWPTITERRKREEVRLMRKLERDNIPLKHLV